jgi:hypothetical protein
MKVLGGLIGEGRQSKPRLALFLRLAHNARAIVDQVRGVRLDSKWCKLV